MPYTSTSKTLNCSFVSSRPGWISWTGSNSVTVEAMGRTGDNGIFQRNNVTQMYIRVPRTKRYVREIITYYTPKRIIVGYRLIEGKPIYRKKLVERKGYPPSYKYELIGRSRTRKKAIYKIVAQPHRRKVWGLKTYFITKLVSLPPIELPDMSPHRLNFSQTERLGHDSGFSVVVSNRNTPSDVVITSIAGMMSGTHCGIGDWGTPVGFNNLMDDATITNSLRSESLYKMSSSARGNIANLTNSFIAEAEGLKNTVADYAIGTVRTLISGKRAIQKAIVDTLSDPKKIAKQYLGYVYGISPLISDINNLIKELNSKSRTWRRYSGRAKYKYTTVSTGGNTFSQWRIERTFSWVVKNQVMVTGTSMAPLIQNHATSNNLAAGWEMIPFSFVADWFIPIGTWLDSLDLFTGVSVKNWHESILYTETYKYTLIHRSTDPNWKIEPTTQQFSGKFVRFRRTIMSGSPSLPLPTLKNPISRGHLVNSLMLLISTLKR